MKKIIIIIMFLFPLLVFSQSNIDSVKLDKGVKKPTMIKFERTKVNEEQLKLNNKEVDNSSDKKQLPKVALMQKRKKTTKSEK